MDLITLSHLFSLPFPSFKFHYLYVPTFSCLDYCTGAFTLLPATRPHPPAQTDSSALGRPVSLTPYPPASTPEYYSNIISVIRDGVEGFRSSPITYSLESRNKVCHLPAYYSFQGLLIVYRTRKVKTRHLLGVGGREGLGVWD